MSTQQANKQPPIKRNGKLPDKDHGNRFESKLLFLFFMRAMDKGHNFHLGAELASYGGKFDDLIFVKDYGQVKQSFLYLQAKHRLHEKSKSITASHLLNDNTGDFSLVKYFHSYRDDVMKAKGGPQPNNQVDCVICTNIDFDKNDLIKNQIKLVPLRQDELNDLPREMLTFKIGTKMTSYCRIDPIRWLEMNFVANVLRDCSTDMKKKLDQQENAFKCYQSALVTEKVIDLMTKKFHQEFLNGNNLSPGAKKLRQIIDGMTITNGSWTRWEFAFNDVKTFCTVAVYQKSLNDKATEKEIEDFFNDKILFAVQTPNEEELNQILKDEVGKTMNLIDAALQFPYIFSELVNFFKSEKNFWLSAEKGKEILLEKTSEKVDSFCAFAMSNNYKKTINLLAFNDEEISKMAEKLKYFIDSSNKSTLQVANVKSKSPQFTTVKVVEALKIISTQFKCDDSFLVTSSSRLEKGGLEMDWMKKALLCEGNAQLLIFVNDNESQMQIVESDNNKKFIFSQSESQFLKGKKSLVIDKNNKTNSKLLLDDVITCKQLSNEAKKDLMSKKVSFQGNDATLWDLIGDGQSDKVLDFQSMEEFLLRKERKSIPSHKRSQFEESLYIDRKFTFDFKLNWIEIADAINKDKKENEQKTTAEELHGQHGAKMKQGNVGWLEDNVKTKILREILKCRNEEMKIIEDDLINEEKWERRAVIIKGVAGTGKSTVLSHYYDAIKEKDPNIWVIRIDLKDHFKSLAQLKGKKDLSDAIDFIAIVADIQSHFGRSLLKHRLETGDRIVLMLDGFDEIDDTCKQIAIELMTSINEKTSTRLYVTTRPDVADNLQFELGQLAYTLVNFSEEDQIQCLSSFWIEKLGNVKDEEIERIREIAKSLVKRVTKDLKDEEKSFVGVPLQCRILAECFLNEVQTDIEDTRKGTGKQSEIIDQQQKFDLVSLYRKLMKTKRQVFRKEKVVTESANHIAEESIEKTIKKLECHLSKLSVQVIISDEKQIAILWPTSLIYRSKSESRKRIEKMDELCVRFGLVDRVGNKLEFLHRTYAEYLLADYLFQGFKLEEDDHNGLMENKSARQLLGQEILVKDQYSGVRIFLNSMLKDIVDSDRWRQNEGETAANLPERLIKFADEILPSACSSACEIKNSNIFVFLFDCLKAAKKQSKIQQVVESAFDKKFLFDIYFQQSSRVFERLIKYYDIKNENKVKFILEKMLRDSKSLRCGDWRHDAEERKKVLKLLLDFMEEAKEKGTLKKCLDRKQICANYEDANLLHFLICQDDYEDHLKQYLQIFSSVYHDKDDALLDLFEELFKRYEYFYEEEKFKKKCRKIFNGKTQNALKIVKDLGREELVSKLSHLVLKRDPVSFDNFYEPKEATGGEEIDESLLERDSARMTRLHRAIFYDQKEIVEKILNWVIKNKENSKVAKEIVEKILNWVIKNKKNSKVAKGIVDYCVARDDYGLTPFYVAFAKGNKELCEKIMKFLSQVLAGDELKEHLEDENGFLQLALFESLIFNEIEMFQFLLAKVKENFGKEILLDWVLMSRNWERNGCGVICHRRECFEIIKNFFIDDDYKKLSDFVFLGQRGSATEMLTNFFTAETVEKMIAADGGIRNWMKRFLLNICDGFRCFGKLIENEIIELNDERRAQLAQFTISFLDGTIEQEERLNEVYRMLHKSRLLRDIMETLFELMGEENVKQVLLDKGGETIKGFIERWKWERKDDEFVHFIKFYLKTFADNDIAKGILEFIYSQKR